MEWKLLCEKYNYKKDHVNVWKRAFQAVKIVSAKVLRQERTWRISRREMWLWTHKQVGTDGTVARSAQ